MPRGRDPAGRPSRPPGFPRVIGLLTRYGHDRGPDDVDAEASGVLVAFLQRPNAGGPVGDCSAESDLAGWNDVVVCEPWESPTWPGERRGCRPYPYRTGVLPVLVLGAEVGDARHFRGRSSASSCPWTCRGYIAHMADPEVGGNARYAGALPPSASRGKVANSGQRLTARPLELARGDGTGVWVDLP